MVAASGAMEFVVSFSLVPVTNGSRLFLFCGSYHCLYAWKDASTQATWNPCLH
jgi:hypothetical protein